MSGSNGAPPGRYAEPSRRHPAPDERPWLDLVAACPPERLPELRLLEQASTWRCGRADRVGLARDGVALLGDLMGQGPGEAARRALDLFGEERFRIALHHAHPGALGPLQWEYWHLRLHGERPRRPAPTVITEMKAAGALPPDAPEPEPTVWPPGGSGRPIDYGECLRRST